MKCLFNKIFIFFLLVLTSNLYSQNTKIDSLSTFEFKWSNDFQFNTDSYFTNGFAFEMVNEAFAENPINYLLISLPKSEFESTGISLIQDIFTPKDKFTVQNQLNGDRPFAAYILLGFSKTGYISENDLKYYSQIQIGVLGPLAFGEETQNGIHRNISTSAQVIGWENQIGNGLLINYSAFLEKILIEYKYFELSGFTSATIGLPFTNANFGFNSKLGIFDSFSNNKWQLFANLSANVGLIGYNATLQGGVFSNEIYSLNKINRLVGNASFGFTAKYKNLILEYSQHFNSSEFPNSDSHAWSHFLIKVEF